MPPTDPKHLTQLLDVLAQIAEIHHRIAALHLDMRDLLRDGKSPTPRLQTDIMTAADELDRASTTFATLMWGKPTETPQ